MELYIFESIVDGFGSGEVDLAAHLSANPAQEDDLISTIIDNIVDVLRSPEAGGSLHVAGHADRDDTAGLTHIQHLAIESDASIDRVNSAIAYIQAQVQLREPSAPADLNTLSYFDVSLRSPGAGVLVADEANLSEARRKLNRRIQARLLVFKPDP